MFNKKLSLSQGSSPFLNTSFVQRSPRISRFDSFGRSLQNQHLHREDFQLNNSVEIVYPQIVEPLELADPQIFELNSENFTEDFDGLSEAISELSDSSCLTYGDDLFANIQHENPLYLECEIHRLQTQDRIANLDQEIQIARSLENVVLNKIPTFLDQTHRELENLEQIGLDLDLSKTRLSIDLKNRISCIKTLSNQPSEFYCSSPLKKLPPIKKVEGFGNFGSGSSGAGNSGNFGGGNWNFGEDPSDWEDLPESLPPGVRIFVIIVAGVVIFVVFKILSKSLNWLYKQLDKAIRDYFRTLDRWIHKRKRNRIRRRIAFLLKCFLSFVGLLAGPEAAAIVAQNIANRWARSLLRCIYPLIRLFTLLALFLGSTFYSLKGIQLILSKLSFLEPYIFKGLTFMNGPSNVPKTVLFGERLAKAFLGSLLLHVSIRIRFACADPQLSSLHNGKRYLELGIFSLCIGSVVFIFWDHFGILRHVVLIFTSHPSLGWLTKCILGRSILLISASMALPRTFWTSTFFMIFVYTFGLYSLLLSASPNLFP